MVGRARPLHCRASLSVSSSGCHLPVRGRYDMNDFLLELLSEEIPARMQAKASADLARLFEARLKEAGLAAQAVETFATPRRLALIARGLPAATEAVREELKGPRSSAPSQALEGFLRKTGLGREALVERDGVYFAVVDRPGRPTAAVLAEAIPAIVRAFPWPKSMRWGGASASTESLRWVRPLQGVVAMLGDEIVEFEIGGIRSGAATVGHRFHHPGPITLGGASDYAEKLRACHVVLDPAERHRIIAEGAAAAAHEAGLRLVDDEGLLAENAGLTEWPVPLLGSFHPAFLDVPPEVIRLTMRTNQKYFALLESVPSFAGERDQRKLGGGARSDAEGETLSNRLGPSPALRAVPISQQVGGRLAPNFICTANIEAADGGAAIVAGNEKVLAARLADARFFWEQDLKVPLEVQAEKLSQIVFHEKFGTVADKVERVARLARWLAEEGIVVPLPGSGEELENLPALAERAARLCKADLVTQMVGEFPELQGVIGGYLASAQGEPNEVAAAVRDHYKPAGQNDEIPIAPVTVAVSLADKLDSLLSFFAIGEKPTGSKDPFALRRSALGILSLLIANGLRVRLTSLFMPWFSDHASARMAGIAKAESGFGELLRARLGEEAGGEAWRRHLGKLDPAFAAIAQDEIGRIHAAERELLDFFADRLKVQQREAGIRHDLIDAVFALGGEDDVVRLLARVRALQGFVETPAGADLLAGYKRAANILRKENWRPLRERLGPEVGGPDTAPAPAGQQQPSPAPIPDPPLPGRGETAASKMLSYTPENEEAALIAALDSAEPRARVAVQVEDFESAMAALASLRGPVDAFFDKVTVNDPDESKRAARLDLLARMRDAVHAVADFSKIEA
jgi:glycyl-tRNA synthetase beta chain